MNSDSDEQENIDLLKNTLSKVFQIETRYAIITALRTYRRSMNTKMMANILEKSESTISYHITEMLKISPKLIEIDTEKTEKLRGKYYRLSDPVANYYKKIDSKEPFQKDIPNLLSDLMIKSDEEIYQFILESVRKHPDLGMMTESTKKGLSFLHTIEKIILNNFTKTEKAIMNKKKPIRKDYPLGGYSLISIVFNTFSIRHSIKIAQIISQFFEKLFVLKEEIDNEIKISDVKEEELITEHYYLFGGVLNEFEFH